MRREKHHYIHLFIIFFLLFFSISFLKAQNNGKIKGVVLDATFKTPIHKAQVYLEGQYLGDVTDYSGAYEILNIPPGIYTIIVDMLGYEKVVKKNIKVHANQVIELNFELEVNPIQGESVVVTATKMGKSLEDIPAAAYVFEKTEILQTDRRNIEELFETVPGVNSIDRFHSGYNYVTFRGIGLHNYVTKGVLVLIDGIPINEAMGRIDFEQIDLDNAKSVEIIKGPVSAIYGPNAFGGAINIVTDEPSFDWHTSLEAMYGTFNSRKIRFGTSGRLDPVGISINASHYASEGYMERNSYETNKISSKFRSDIGQLGSVILTADYVKANTEWPGSLTQEQFENQSTEANNKYTGSKKDFYMFGLSHSKYWSKKSNLQTVFYYRKKKDDYGYSDYFRIHKDYDYYGAESKIQTGFDFLYGKNNLIAGVSFTREDGRLTYINLDREGNLTDVITEDGRNTYDMYGIYVQDDYSPIEKLTFSFGLRYDMVHYDWKDYLTDRNTSATTTVDAFNPKISLLYKYRPSLIAYANIAKGFNPPESDDLFTGNLRYNRYPNPNLKPQYLTNYEIGFRGNIINRIQYQLALFYMDFKDQIESVPIPGDTTGAERYENVGRTSHKGLELSVRTQLTKNFALTAVYSYIKAKFEDYPDYAGNTIRRTPENQGTIKLEYRNSWGLWGNISAKWVGEYYMDNDNVNVYEGYTLVNARLGYKYNNKYSISVNINNLLDTYYAVYASAYFRSFPPPGYWSYSYSPGWPFNVTVTLGVEL